ncbi:hypothetical protein PCL_06229 [Purpureocillium lilacinum]|uniref:Uncharacterized protein n=1 Tax=Purpureocillium lilacinum TaxID=33203 RepID=A0A2U3EM36_PURLI|nr:hypothetical protein Purlil1_4121 [Purpureocillium lilacinum]PWI75571.1 hypothetical protein PCL_06229 [Purpureocillium lilacinum]
MMAAPCEWDEPCARARAPSPWNPLPGSTKAPAVTKCPEPSRAGLCGCSSGTALSARPAGWMDDGTPAVVKARLPVAAVHGGRQIRLRERGQTTLLPCHCSFGAKERADRSNDGRHGRGSRSVFVQETARLLPWNNNTVRVCCTSCSPPPNNKHHSRPRFLFCVFIVPPPRARATPEAGFGWLAVVVVLRDRPSPPSSTSSPLGLLTCPCTALARSLAPHADGRPARALSPPLESSPDGATLCRAGSRGRMDDGGGGGGGVHEAQGGGMVRKQAGRGIAWSTAIRRWDDGGRWMQG